MPIALLTSNMGQLLNELLTFFLSSYFLQLSCLFVSFAPSSLPPSEIMELAQAAVFAAQFYVLV